MYEALDQELSSQLSPEQLSVCSQQRKVTVSRCTLHCSSSTHWSAQLGRGWEQLALGYTLKDRANYKLGRVDLDNIVAMLSQLDAVVLLQVIAGIRQYQLTLGHRRTLVNVLLLPKR